jgi:hypothetical protein
MKGLTTTVFLLICSLIIISCSEDKDNEENELPVVRGAFTVEGTSYELHDGSISYWGSEGDTLFYFGCILHTSDIYYKMDHGYVGKGSGVAFFIASSVQNTFVTTSFPINGTGQVQKDEAFDVELYPEWEPDGDNSNNLDYFYCTSGTIKINGESDTLTINIEGRANKMNSVTDEVVAEDIPVSVNYTGVL